MLISQKSPENPGGHKQEENANGPSASVHVPPFRQGELEDRDTQCKHTSGEVRRAVQLYHNILNSVVIEQPLVTR